MWRNRRIAKLGMAQGPLDMLHLGLVSLCVEKVAKAVSLQSAKSVTDAAYLGSNMKKTCQT